MIAVILLYKTLKEVGRTNNNQKKFIHFHTEIVFYKL